ncbi:MAG: DNA repair protein RecN [Luteibaculaceae bacterium]
MLKKLLINDFALIRSAEITFGKGLTVISGETGSGKSIMFDALGYLLGQRADTGVIGKNATKCVIEAHFSSTKKSAEFLKDEGFSVEPELIIRREIYATGRSRNFINDGVATLQQLKQVGDLLVDIHAQHQTLLLNNKVYQLNLLDAFAGNSSILFAYQQQLELHKNITQQIVEKQTLLQKLQQESEFIRFQLEQFEALKWKAEELANLEADVVVAENAASIKTDLLFLNQGIDGDAQTLLSIYAKLLPVARKLAQVYKPAESILERLEAAKIELSDIAEECYSLQENISVEPETLRFMQERLSSLYAFMQKHKLNTEEETFAFVESLEKKSNSTEALEEEIKTLSAEQKQVFEAVKLGAEKLYESRELALPNFIASVVKNLVNLEMEHTSLQGIFSEAEGYGKWGKQHFQLEIATAKGEKLRTLDKVASGGELSRIMLSFKILLAQLGEIPTLIFDEIETGVSGKVADKMGKLLKETAQNAQIISITHLPQIAAMGNHHFKAFKQTDQVGTQSVIKELTPAEKLQEIASMLSGDKVTEAALQNAKALLGLT